MAYYPPPGSQPHSVYSPPPSVTAHRTSPPHYPSHRSRRHSSSSSSSSFPGQSYPPVIPPSNYGSNSYPYWYGQGYSRTPTTASTSPNVPMYAFPQQPQPVPQTQHSPFYGNPYIPPSRTVAQVPGRTMGPGASYQNYYPMQGSQVGQPQTIVVKVEGGRRRHKRHHHRRRSSSY